MLDRAGCAFQVDRKPAESLTVRCNYLGFFGRPRRRESGSKAGKFVAQGHSLPWLVRLDAELMMMMRLVGKVVVFPVVVMMLLQGCGVQGRAQGAVKEFPTPEGVAYYYFTCDSTARELSEATRLKCEDAQCISLSRTYAVSEDLVAAGYDTCSIIRTTTLGSLSADATIMGTFAFRRDAPPELNHLHAPDTAMLSGESDVKVSYKQAGLYKFWLTRARHAVAVELVQ